MTGPVTKPLPLYGSHPADLQAREEVERLRALEDAEFDREAEVEARAEFLPVPDARGERMELEWRRMERERNPNEEYHDRYRGVFG